MKSTLKITSKGQVTLRKRMLDELGVRPGDRITVEVLEPGRAELKAAKPSGSFERYFGMLASPGNPKLTIEEINEIIAKGWAGEL
jgi:bifunctional DNA-binding transcriptional regulator/antitoxin component of YhaV-PrlF toxin-antitoxin module